MIGFDDLWPISSMCTWKIVHWNIRCYNILMTNEIYIWNKLLMEKIHQYLVVLWFSSINCDACAGSDHLIETGWKVTTHFTKETRQLACGFDIRYTNHLLDMHVHYTVLKLPNCTWIVDVKAWFDFKNRPIFSSLGLLIKSGTSLMAAQNYHPWPSPDNPDYSIPFPHSDWFIHCAKTPTDIARK